MNPVPKIITLTTDFGLQDGYVAAVKGVILSIAPDACLVDITHEIPPQDITAAAFVIASTAPFFPSHTVHLVVVDPGVGTTRRMIAAQNDWGLFVAPDNGVLSLVWQQCPMTEIVYLAEPRFWRQGPISHTFHGRDIMGPVAAHLANGTPLEQLGPPAAAPITLPILEPHHEPDGRILGEIIYVDHFGNLISNIPSRKLTSQASIRLGDVVLPRISQTYAEVPIGHPVALVGSHGYLEIAVREGNAAAVLGYARGEAVIVTPTQAQEVA